MIADQENRRERASSPESRVIGKPENLTADER
jgi:hypothetical protein